MTNNNEIEFLLKDYEKFHSEFQIKNFIINSQGPTWFQYKQCLKEIKSRYNQILNLRDDIQLMEIELNKLEKSKKWIGKIGKLKKEIEIRKKQRELEEIRNTLIDLIREFNIFVKLAKDIKKNYLGNDSLSELKKNSLEEIAWIEKIKFMMAIDLMIIGNLSKPTIEIIYSMPRKIKKELLSNLGNENQQKLIQWAME